MIEKGEYLMFYHDEMYEPLTALIESLREVVGIAAHPDAYENWEAMLADAVSALPTWILDNDGSQ